MAAPLQLDLKSLPSWLAEQGRRARQADLGPALRACAVALSAAYKECFDRSQAPDGTPWRPLAHDRPDGSNVPLRDKGLLMASVSAREAAGHVEQVGRASLVFGTSVIGAALHQHGGTIRPRHARYLAIPITAEARRTTSPRQFPRPLHLMRSRRGSLLLAENGTGTPQYVLKDSVTVPARPFLGFGPKLLQTIDSIFADFFAKAYGGGK